MLHDVFYGSVEGGWQYPLVNGNVVWPVKLGAGLSVAAAALLWATWRRVDGRPALVVSVWLLFGFGAQLGMRTLAPYPDTHVVGTRTDPFHRESLNYPPGRFLRDARALAPHLHFHVRANMAGKVLFYHALRAVDDAPLSLYLLIVVASNVGALLAYATVRELFADRRAGLAALALYLVLPSKLYFLPLLNAVTPTFILLPLWLLVRYLTTHRPEWLVAMGGAVYALVLFEPLPLVTGLVFLALIGRAWARGAVGGRHVAAVLGVVPLTFFAVNAAVAVGFGYEIVGAFRFALDDARAFNDSHNRPYDLWAVANLIETLGNTGVLTSALAVGVAAGGVLRAARGWTWADATAVLCEPAVCLAVSCLLTLAVVDLMGVNRGETVRLWIFLGAFLQLPVAGACARRPVLLAALLTGSIVQACVGLGSRGFICPG